MSYHGEERRRKNKDQNDEILSRLGSIELSVGILVQEVKANHNSFKDVEEEWKQRNRKIEETIYGNGKAGLTSRMNSVESLKSNIESHTTMDKWMFGTVITILVFILGKLIVGG